MSERLPIETQSGNRLLTAAEFHRLADVPPEVEWFANITNLHTRRAYENAVRNFMQFAGIRRPEEFRIVTRSHIIKWRDDLVQRELGGSTNRHRLALLPRCSNIFANGMPSRNHAPAAVGQSSTLIREDASLAP
jgi:hypothetical protein